MAVDVNNKNEEIQEVDKVSGEVIEEKEAEEKEAVTKSQSVMKGGLGLGKNHCCCPCMCRTHYTICYSKCQSSFSIYGNYYYDGGQTYC